MANIFFQLKACAIPVLVAMSYQDLKKLDEETLQKLREGSGPSDKCICNLLSEPAQKKSFGTSLKKAFGIAKKSPGNNVVQRSIMVPLNTGGKGLRSTKEVVKRTSSCGKCGCDSNQVVLKHSYANIRITSPDLSSVCPCPTDCLPDKEKMKNNIKVIVEHAQIESHPMPSAQLTEFFAQSESTSGIDDHDVTIINTYTRQ